MIQGMIQSAFIAMIIGTVTRSFETMMKVATAASLVVGLVSYHYFDPLAYSFVYRRGRCIDAD